MTMITDWLAARTSTMAQTVTAPDGTMEMMHDQPPIILNVMDGLFAGGSPIIHADIIADMARRGLGEHAVLSLSDKMLREHTTQTIEDTLPYRTLEGLVGLHRLHRTSDDPMEHVDLTYLSQLVRGSDLVICLKEQPLATIDVIDASTPTIVALHRTDPDPDGPGIAAMRTQAEAGRLKMAICCANTVRTVYAAAGVPDELLTVVMNGIDLDRFRPDPLQRAILRTALAIPDTAPVIIWSARFDPMKNPPLFVQSAARFLTEVPDAHFILCGAGMSNDNMDLQNMLDKHIPERLHARFHRQGIVSDMAAVYPAGDMIVLTSAYGEAGPLSLLEGMAAGLVPVTTDVGDSALIVSNDDLVTSNDPNDVAGAWARAWAHHEELARHILDDRARLSEDQCYDEWAALLDGVIEDL